MWQTSPKNDNKCGHSSNKIEIEDIHKMCGLIPDDEMYIYVCRV